MSWNILAIGVDIEFVFGGRGRRKVAGNEAGVLGGRVDRTNALLRGHQLMERCVSYRCIL